MTTPMNLALYLTPGQEALKLVDATLGIFQDKFEDMAQYEVICDLWVIKRPDIENVFDHVGSYLARSQQMRQQLPIWEGLGKDSAKATEAACHMMRSTLMMSESRSWFKKRTRLSEVLRLSGEFGSLYSWTLLMSATIIEALESPNG
jgi:hypothetical protein